MKRIGMLAAFVMAFGACAASDEGTTGGGDKEDGFGDLSDVIDNIEVARYAIKTGLVTGLYAKEVCSCVFVTGLPEDTCRDRVKLAVENLIVDTDVDGNVVRADGRLTGPLIDLMNLLLSEDSELESLLNPAYEATFDTANPQLGCRITKRGTTAF